MLAWDVGVASQGFGCGGPRAAVSVRKTAREPPAAGSDDWGGREPGPHRFAGKHRMILSDPMTAVLGTTAEVTRLSNSPKRGEGADA